MVNLLEPNEAYVIQSGERAGKSPSLLMFSNPSFIYWMYKNLQKKMGRNSQKNNFHRQLEWLILQGENRQTVKRCPHCKAKTVKYYSVRKSYEGSSIGAIYTYCEDCAKDRGDMRTYLEEFKFSNLRKYDRKGNGVFFRKLSKLYRWAFGLEGRLNRDKAFQFFKS